MARNPLYPSTPAQTAVDRLLNETLPRIISDKQDANERRQMREDALAQNAITNKLARDKWLEEKERNRILDDKDKKDDHWENASVMLGIADGLENTEDKLKIYGQAEEQIRLSGKDPLHYGLTEEGGLVKQITLEQKADKVYDKYYPCIDPSTNSSCTEEDIKTSWEEIRKVKSDLSEVKRTTFGNTVSGWNTSSDTRLDFFKKPEFNINTIDALDQAAVDSKIDTNFWVVTPEAREDIIKFIQSQKTQGLSEEGYSLAKPTVTEEEIQAYYEEHYDIGGNQRKAGTEYLSQWYQTLDKKEERNIYLKEGISPELAIIDARRIATALSATVRSGKIEEKKKPDGTIERIEDPLSGEALLKEVRDFGVPEFLIIELTQEGRFEDYVAPANTDVVNKEEAARLAKFDKNLKVQMEKDKKLLIVNSWGQGLGDDWAAVKNHEPNSPRRMKAEANIASAIEKFNTDYPGQELTFDDVYQLYLKSKER